MNGFFKHNFWAVIGVVFCCFALGVILFWFQNIVTEKIEKTTQTYLNENVNALSTVFYTKLDDQLTMLESQTRYFKEIDLSNYNLMKDTIMATKGIGEFKTIGVANAAGATMNYNGKSSGNIYLEDYYQEAMKGANAISNTTVTDEDGDEVLVLAVPIMRNRTTVGIVYGTFTKQILNSLVDTVKFGESGANVLIDESGDIIARTTSTSIIPQNAANLFNDVTHLNVELKENSNNIFSFQTKSQTLTAVITSVGAHDWYFATLFPESVVATQAENISHYVFIIILIIIFVFVLLFLFILFLMKNNDMILRSNERFKFANSQSQNVIFDYDYAHKQMRLEGNVEIVTKDIKSVYSYDDVLGFLNLIHDADRSIADQFLAARNNSATNFQGELRVLCVDGNYYWFKMKATVVRGVNGVPIQMIGSFVNVDEQINKELNLIKKAEIDPLTGLLNKGAFESHVSQTLAESDKDDIRVFYIIDLDNFKAVNDNLGHAMGDKVLTDVSRKLGTIFNEFDHVGRIGGDEFAAFMILPKDITDPEKQVVSHGEAICRKIREEYGSDDVIVRVSSSVGVSVYPSAGSDYKTLYKNADVALYKVKENGKDRFEVYSPQNQ